MNILIVKTSAIGDVIHTLPAVNCLRQHYPHARIDWLVEEAAAQAVWGQRSVDGVLVSRRKYWLGLWHAGRRRAAWQGFWSFVRELRATRYDLLIDFQGLLKSGIFVLLARAGRKVGFGRGMDHAEGSWLFLNEPVPPVSMDQHAIERERLLLAAIGVSCPDIVFDLPLGTADAQQADALLAECGGDPHQPVVAINPMTTWPTKHWLDGRFVQVAEHLLAMGVRVVFTGGANDHPAIEGMLAQMRRPACNLAGRTTLTTLAALYRRTAMLITTDTGPMHIAAAVGTPVVALFGPTAPWRTGPFGPAHRVLRVDLPCSPCLKKHCPRQHQCMDELSVEQVLAAVRALLAQG